MKQAAGRFAAQLVQDGMIIGLGTGSTSICFIEALGQRVNNEGLKISGVASSKHSWNLAKALGLTMLDDMTSLDLTIDGADEIDPKKRMIKGGGGALVREKIIASSSKEMIVIVDETKLVQALGAFGLPIEIIPFCPSATLYKLKNLGFEATIRQTKENKPFITDNQNFIVDLHPHPLFQDVEKAEKIISSVPGVVETGFFIGLAGRVVVGKSDGSASMS